MGAAYLGSVRSFRVTPCSLHPRGQGAKFGVAGQVVAVGGSPVDAVHGQSGLFSPLASSPKQTVEML